MVYQDGREPLVLRTAPTDNRANRQTQTESNRDNPAILHANCYTMLLP